MKFWPLVLLALAACSDPSGAKTVEPRTLVLVSARKLPNHELDEYHGCAITWLSGSLTLRPRSTEPIEEGSFEQRLRQHRICDTSPAVDTIEALRYQGSYRWFSAGLGEQPSIGMAFDGTDVAFQSDTYGDTVRVILGMHGSFDTPTMGVDSNWIFNFVPSP